MFSPRKEHQCLTWKLNTHTHKSLLFCPHWALLNSRKVCHACKYVSLPLSQSKCYRETKIPHLLSLGKWIVEDCASERSSKDQNNSANESWEFGLWSGSQSPLFLTLGKHLSSLYLYSSIWKSRIIPAAYLTLKGYVRISQLKFGKCLETNGGGNLYEHKALLTSPLFLFLFLRIAVLGDVVNISCGFASRCFCGKGLFHFISHLLNGLFESHPVCIIKGRFLNILVPGCHTWRSFYCVYL